MDCLCSLLHDLGCGVILMGLLLGAILTLDLMVRHELPR